MFGKSNKTETPKVTKEEIVNYITNMNIRTFGLGGGGLDKVDVYFHIQQIVTMYDAYLKGELEEMEKKHEEELNRLMGNVPEGEQGEQGVEQPIIRSESQIIRELEKNFKALNQEVVDYLNKMDIKKATFGGFDRADVYARIQDIAIMQGKIIEKMRKSYENEIIRLHRMIPKDGW